MRALLSIITLFFALFLISCGDTIIYSDVPAADPKDKVPTGGVLMKVEGTIPANLTNSTLRARLSKSGEVTLDTEIPLTETTTIQFNDVPSGEWTLTVDALKNNKVKYTGSDTVVVEIGEIASKNINMEKVNFGFGGVDIDITF